MTSRRELVQGYQFAARRVVSAVVLRQTDPQEWPFRRLGGAGVGTVMLTVVALAGAGIYGMVFPGGKTSWRDGRTVIVDKRTGASYVFVDGRLHPVLNFASAALLVGSTTVTRTTASSLAGVPRGVEVGISGAPAALPTPQDLVSPPWSLCTEQVPDESGTPVSRTRLVVGRGPGRGRPPGDDAVLVTDTADRSRHLIWHDRRYLLADPGPDGSALALDSQVNVPVGDAWLAALPAGRPIAVLRLAGAGRPSTAVPSAVPSAAPSARIGQLFQVVAQDQGTQYYLADTDRLIPVSELQALIQQAAGATLTPLSLGEATTARKAPAPPTDPSQPPTSRPRFVRPQQSATVLCASDTEGSFAPQVLVDSAIPAGGGVSTAGVGPAGTAVADRIWLPPGRAALVEALPSPQAEHGPLYLVTDVGRRYAIGSGEVLRALGLDGATTSKLPAGLLVRVPEGPALDPELARLPLAQENVKR
jgi:type VII secretion protein EccB